MRMPSFSQVACARRRSCGRRRPRRHVLELEAARPRRCAARRRRRASSRPAASRSRALPQVLAQRRSARRRCAAAGRAGRTPPAAAARGTARAASARPVPAGPCAANSELLNRLLARLRRLVAVDPLEVVGESRAPRARGCPGNRPAQVHQVGLHALAHAGLEDLLLDQARRATCGPRAGAPSARAEYSWMMSNSPALKASIETAPSL